MENRQGAVKLTCIEPNQGEVDKKEERPTGAIKKRQAPKLPVEDAEVSKRVTRAAAKVLTLSYPTLILLVYTFLKSSNPIIHMYLQFFLFLFLVASTGWSTVIEICTR